MDFYILKNSNNYVIKKLRDETGEIVNDANLTVEFREYDPETEASSPVTQAGGTAVGWPLAFVPEGAGDYRVAIPADLDLVSSQEYLAIIEGTAGGRILHEKRRVFAHERLTR